MPELYLDYESTTRGGEVHSDEPYSSRDPEYTDVSIRRLFRDRDHVGTFCPEKFTVSEELYNCRTLFLVTVIYQTGNTFGTSYGNPCFVGLYKTVEEAQEVEANILKGTYKPTPPDFLTQRGYEATSEYLPWKGYFERLEDVKIDVLSVI